MSSSSPPPTLIPGLPNHISTLILSLTPFPYFPLLKQVSKPWRKFFTSKTHLISTLRRSLPPMHSTLSHLICIFPSDPSLTSSFLFDPFLLSWSPPLPPLPINPHTYSLSNFSAVSLGPTIYILGGSLFDTRSFPLDVPCSSNKLFKYDVVAGKWQSLPPMKTPRGSFACAVGRVEERGGEREYIMVAGGGSRHRMFMAAGSRVEGVERYDVERGVWEEMEGLPGERAGCEGFWVKGREKGEGGEKMEFWVMGGYGEGRTISGVLPVDEFYKDAVVMEVSGEGGKWRWREVGDMWKDGERVKLGKVAVLEDEDGGGVDGEVGVFMLDENHIFR